MILLKAKVDAYAIAEAAIRGAIVAARARRIKVRPGTPGVLWGELSNTWVEDPGEEGVDPVGALMLGRTTDHSDPLLAAASELGVSWMWLTGVIVAFGGDAVRGGPMYTCGVEFGLELRKEFLR